MMMDGMQWIVWGMMVFSLGVAFKLGSLISAQSAKKPTTNDFENKAESNQEHNINEEQKKEDDHELPSSHNINEEQKRRDDHELSSSEEDEAVEEEEGNPHPLHRLTKLQFPPPPKKVNRKSRKEEEHKKKKKVKDADWEWPAYDEWYSRLTWKIERQLRISSNEPKESKGIPFEVVYRNEEDMPIKVWVTLLSSQLLPIVRDCLPMNKQMLMSKPKVDGQELFLAMEKLRSYAVDEQNAVAMLHLHHLMRFLEQEYKDTKIQFERMQLERTVSWEMLWAFLIPGNKVLYHCEMSGAPLCAIINGRWYSKDMQGKKLVVELEVMDYNGQSYRKCRLDREIPEFRNERPFSSLSVCPMEFVEQREQTESMFLANGEIFYKLSTQPHCFMHYEGSLLRVELIPGTSCRQIVKLKADGRVMIDLWSFARMNPGYSMRNARPPTSCTTCSSSMVDEPDDEELMLAPAIVFGFSFGLKKWGSFQATGVSHISFDDQAFDRHLVMQNETQKKMLLGLVTQYLKTDTNVPLIDFISNKGEGCVFLCYGPPGTGKTLTAESIAEKLHRPLWSVSASELGITAGDLESKLLQILDIASSWRAVLLLDEADIYLEKRTSGGDPWRNTTTGIFLRLLEYYRGVLFLTTNRVTTFDDAFCSRISMFLRYYPLSFGERAKVWGNFLRLSGLGNAEFDKFAEYELNGREIRNCIRTAQTWAMSCSEPLTSGHILKVVEMLQGFREDLDNALHEEVRNERRFSSILSKLQDQNGSALLHHETADYEHANGAISSA